MSTKITYNGKTTELADGYIATLPCKDLKMETDVVVEAPEPAESGGAELNIAYGDTAPEDTSKLWVKTSKPSKVKVSGELKIAETNTSTFERLGTVLPAKRQHASGGTINNKMYLISGYTTNWVTSIEKYDIDTDTVTTISTKTPYPSNYTGFAASNEKIYIFGGRDASIGEIKSTILMFDGKTETISTMSAALPNPILNICAIAYGSKIYLFGGASTYTTSATYYNTIYRYDTEDDTITVLDAVLPVGLQSISGCCIEKYIYLFGGQTYSDKQKYIWRFDCESETIITVNEELSRGISSACVVPWQGNIYIFDNYGGKGIYFFDVSNEIVVATGITSASNYGERIYAVTRDGIYLTGAIYPSADSIYRFLPGMSLIIPTGTLQIKPSIDKNIFNIINTDTMQVEIGASKVYKGNAEGIGEEVEAALHNGTSWVTI